MMRHHVILQALIRALACLGIILYEAMAFPALVNWRYVQALYYTL
jgi:hypothetical protein